MCFLIVGFLCLVRVNVVIYSSTAGKGTKIKHIFCFGIYGIRMCFSIVEFLRLVRVNAAIYSFTTGKGTKNKTRLRLGRVIFCASLLFLAALTLTRLEIND